MERGSLRDLYITELKKSRDAEAQLVSALPGVLAAASAEELRRVFQSHLEHTKDHLARLEMMLDALGEKPRTKITAQPTQPTQGKKCAGMETLIAELQDLQQEGLSSDILDLALIAYVQRIEHYEMALYGTLRDYAHALGDGDTALHLQSTWEEEQSTDRQLTSIGQAITARVASTELAKEKIRSSFAEATPSKIKPAA